MKIILILDLALIFLFSMVKMFKGGYIELSNYFDYFNIGVDQRVRMAALYLEDLFLGWYRWVVRSLGRRLTWLEFELELLG